jgi:hypothetical protein
VTTDDFNEEQASPARPSSWSAALQQLPGLISEQPVSIPRPAGKARAVSSEVDEDLDGDDEPAQ